MSQLPTEVLSFVDRVLQHASCALGNSFAGISTSVRLLLDKRAVSGGKGTPSGTVAQLLAQVRKLSLLLEAASTTAADALAFRRPALAAVLASFGVEPPWVSQQNVHTAHMFTHAGMSPLVYPEWALAVQVCARTSHAAVNACRHVQIKFADCTIQCLSATG